MLQVIQNFVSQCSVAEATLLAIFAGVLILAVGVEIGRAAALLQNLIGG